MLKCQIHNNRSSKEILTKQDLRSNNDYKIFCYYVREDVVKGVEKETLLVNSLEFISLPRKNS